LAAKERYTRDGQKIVHVEHEARGPLDWGEKDPSFGSRKDHVRKHGVDDPERTVAHGVFNGDPIITTQQAWRRAVENNMKPFQYGAQGRWIYDIPMPSAGKQLGNPLLPGYGNSTSHVRIIVEPNTNRIVTSYPTNLNY